MKDLLYSTTFNSDELSISIFQSGYAKITYGWNWEMANPPFSRLYYMADGEANLIIGGKHTILNKNHVYLLPTGCPLQNYSTPFMEQLFFHINIFDFSGKDILSNCRFFGGIPVNDISDLIRLYKSSDIIDSLLLRQRIISDCILFLKQSGCIFPSNNYSNTVKRAITFIRQNCSAKLSIKDLCSELFISKSTLNYSFQKEIGKSVGKYINDMVLEQSRTMLTNESISISAISDALGFCDQFYFSRKFKKKYGETPSTYRKNNFVPSFIEK